MSKSRCNPSCELAMNKWRKITHRDGCFVFILGWVFNSINVYQIFGYSGKLFSLKLFLWCILVFKAENFVVWVFRFVDFGCWTGTVIIWIDSTIFCSTPCMACLLCSVFTLCTFWSICMAYPLCMVFLPSWTLLPRTSVYHSYCCKVDLVYQELFFQCISFSLATPLS